MKIPFRILSVFIALLFLFPSSASSEIENPLESYSLDELIAVKLLFEAEIASRECEIKNVTVPIGKYYVGMDIPVGIYTLSCADEVWYSSVSVYDENGERISFDIISPGEKIGKLELLYGYQVKIEYEAVIFSTYQGLGF